MYMVITEGGQGHGYGQEELTIDVTSNILCIQLWHMRKKIIIYHTYLYASVHIFLCIQECGSS